MVTGCTRQRWIAACSSVVAPFTTLTTITITAPLSCSVAVQWTGKIRPNRWPHGYLKWNAKRYLQPCYKQFRRSNNNFKAAIVNAQRAMPSTSPPACDWSTQVVTAPARSTRCRISFDTSPAGQASDLTMIAIARLYQRSPPIFTALNFTALNFTAL